MVDAEAKPVGIAIDGGEIIDVEVYRNLTSYLLASGQYSHHFTHHHISQNAQIDGYMDQNDIYMSMIDESWFS